jgi:ABC-type lipoprotein export system ATPase subunit
VRGRDVSPPGGESTRRCPFAVPRRGGPPGGALPPSRAPDGPPGGARRGDRYRELVPVLAADGLTKTVGSGRAARLLLDGVSLSVETDEVVAVLGRSGSGKSTLLHLLGGLDTPDAGSISVAGERLTGRSSRALARARLRHVGFVFQQFQLIEELTGLENVLLPAHLPGAAPGGASHAAELIDELGLTEVAGHLPHELSGGEQQRFAIARALVNRPELLLADEPTGSLDADNGAAVLELLRTMTGRAVVIVTHEPDAAAIADRVLHLSDGRLWAPEQVR